MGSSCSKCFSRPKKKIEYDENFFYDKESENYDMILNFYSFEQLKKNGYICYFTEGGKKKYDKFQNEYNIVIGILGMKNRGKSYLLGKIMQNKDYKPPSGFLTTTYGISCNFPQMEENGALFITLDTAGRDSPLLLNDIFKEIDGKNLIKDQNITEIVLSDFIIQESNILIVVLEQLSFEEQELLKTLIERLKKKEIKGIEKRRLLVIHNLMNITDINGIKKFIDEILLKSLTFKLEKQSMRKTDSFDDSERNVYIQIIDDDNENHNKLEIIHLIYGNKDIKAIDNEYNEPALRYIRDYITINSIRKFDVVKSFHDFLIKNSSKYLTGIEFNEKSIIIGREENIKKRNGDLSINKTIIPLKSKDLKFDVKAYVKDLGGNETFYNKINPRYSTRLIKKENKKFYIEVIFELYGKVKKLKRKIVPDEDKNQYIILIKGEIEEIEKSGNFMEGNLEYTDFDFQITIQKFIMANRKEIEIEILEQQEKEIDIEKNNLGIYKLYLESNIFDTEV